MTSGISNISFRKDQQTIQQETMPKDLVKVVGKVRLIAIEVIAHIKAFFIVILNSGLKDFGKNFHSEVFKISADEKLKSYKKHKKTPLHERAFTRLTGCRVSTREEVEKMKESGTNFKVYQIFKATVSKDEFDSIDKLLEEIKHENEDNYYATLVPLNELMKNKRYPQKVRDLVA